MIGLLGIEKANLFTHNHMLLLNKVAPHLAILIKNSQIYEQRVRELRAVSTFQQKISDVAELEKEEINSIYKQAHEALQGVGLDTENMLVDLYHADNETIEFPMVYERGEPIADSLKIWGTENEMYTTRIIGDRGDLPEYIVSSRTTLLGRTKDEIENWKYKLPGIQRAPSRSRSWLGTPMFASGELVGMIALRNFDREHVFQEHHVDLLKTVAAQTAVAIHNARQYQRIRKQAEQVGALYAAGKTITQAGLDRAKVCEAILEQAIKVTNANFGTFQLVEGDTLKFMAAFPAEHMPELLEKYGAMPITGKGITTRAARDNQAQLVPDVTLDQGFLDVTGRTGCELAVVLRKGDEKIGKPIGVINVEHPEKGKLTLEDRDLLITLANLAVVALENVEQAENLQSTNAVALMGAWGADVVHDVNREVRHIRSVLFRLRHRHDLVPEVRQSLADIDATAVRLGLPELPERAPTLDEIQRTKSEIDRIIRTEVEQTMRDLTDKQSRVSIVAACECRGVKVVMHEQWLRRLLRNYIKNAIRHLAALDVDSNSKEKPLVTVQTQRRSQEVIVFVSDNGSGIRPEIRNILFRQPIEHVSDRAQDRPGRGLLLVQYIARVHGGQAWLDWSEVGQGTRFAFSVPILLGE